MRSGGRSRPSGSCWTTAPQSSSPPRRSDCRSSGGVNVTRCARRVAGSGNCCSPCWLTARRRCSCAWVGRPPSTAERRCVKWSAAGCAGFRSACSATCATPCSGHAALPASSARRRARTLRQSRCSRPGWRGWRSWCRIGTCRARGRAAGSALRSRRSAPTSSKEQRSCSTRSVSTNVRANADLVVTGEGAVDATTLEGKAPGAVVRRCKLLGVRCELFGGTVRRGMRAHALSGRRARAGDDLLLLGEQLAGALVDSG